MKAQFVYESVHFQRGVDPMDSMRVGRAGRRQNEKYLKEISEIVGTDISKEMPKILDILDDDGIFITSVDTEYSEDPTKYPIGKSRMWVSWENETGREGAEEFAFVQFPKVVPKRWYRKRKSVWDENDPHESGHNAQVISKILEEMIWQTRTNWPRQRSDWSKEQWEDFRRELSFLNRK